MMSENDCIPHSIHHVSRHVNTARIKNISTVRIGMADDERDPINIERGERLAVYRQAAGFKTAAAAARANRWGEPAYRSHENGYRTIGPDDADRYAAGLSRPGRKISGQDIMYGPPDNPASPSEQGIRHVQVMGKIGAGAIVEPEYEQVPPDGLHQVELPYPVPEDLIGFQVEGDSMMPRYDDGDVILVWRDQKRPLETFYGQEAAVRTSDGRRYVKTILYGKSRSLVNLQSFNAKLIEGVRLEWIGEIYSTIRADQVQRSLRRRRTTGKRDARKGSER
jgi:phage repressor protein C with HTH and peptisase S24 domain